MCAFGRHEYDKEIGNVWMGKPNQKKNGSVEYIKSFKDSQDLNIIILRLLTSVPI